MATFRWQRPRTPYQHLPFIKSIGETRVIVCAMPEAYLRVYIHFLGHGSVPCIDGQCPHCASKPAELHSYAPALFQYSNNNEWCRGILDLGDPQTGIATTDLRNQVTWLYRTKKADGTYTGLRIKEVTPLNPVIAERLNVQWFDIRARLEQRWGMRAVQETETETPAADVARPGETVEPDDSHLILPFVGRKSA